jgi:hypothetical protein
MKGAVKEIRQRREQVMTLRKKVKRIEEIPVLSDDNDAI